MAIKENVLQAIGSTPLIRINGAAQGAKGEVVAKVESFNPGGSVKDRVALSMIEDAERSGRLQKGGAIVEATSGNTGVGLAMAAAVKGYRAIIVMPASMSVERRKLMAAYGARLVLTDGAAGMPGAIAEAQRIVKENKGYAMASQFSNPANPEAHVKTTGPEIWQQAEGKVDVFVAGVGTGGVVTGVGRYLKQRNPSVKVVAVEPAASAVLSGRPKGPHGIQGIGAGFKPEVLDESAYDEVFPVTDDDAMAAARALAAKDGLLVGISSGAAAFAAIEIAKRPESKGKRIVVLLPDTGERYLSTALFASEGL